MPATCGNCKATGVGVEHVRSCYGFGGKPDAVEFSEPPQAPTFRVGKPMNKDKVGPVQEEDRVYLNVPFANKDEVKNQFGGKWDSQKRQWYVDKSADFDEMPPEWLAEKSDYVAKDGMYEYEGRIIKIITAQYTESAGFSYARELTVIDRIPSEMNPDRPEFTKKGKFVKAPGMQFKVQPEHLMSHEKAVEFGQLYGFCVRCGAVLTDEESIERGMGPTCAEK